MELHCGKSMEENSHRIISSFSATTGERYNDLFKKYLSLLQRVPQHIVAA